MKLLLASTILISFSPVSVWAQEPTPELEPQKVTAITENQCGDQVYQSTLDVWNVGAEGGAAYAEAVVYTHACVMSEPPELVDVEPFYGTFSGGPNGIATVEICLTSTCNTVNFQFVDGTQVKVVDEDAIVFIVQNPEAFEVDFADTGLDCTADIHYDPALKPGDVLSPWSTYTAVPGGQEVIPIGEAYFINGIQTPSAVWDGKETTIELQYTCPGHQGHITTLTIPEAGNPTFTPTAILTFTPVGTGTSTPEITDTPNPTNTSTPEASATFTSTPTKPPCKALSADAKLTQILNRYYAQIPRGITDSGNKNNLLTLWDDKYNEYVCGSYQGKVLQLLSDIKFNSDPCVSALLDDWDYGPIEALWGGHQAVVIYPRGTTWTDTGLVLDPWITQTPQVYTIQDWSLEFSAGSQHGVRGSSDYEEQAQYPTVGGNYTQPGDLKLTAEENDFIRTLPTDKQDWLKKMSPVNRKTWVIQIMRRQTQNATLSVNSPLDIYLTDDAGHFAGFMYGNIMNDLPDVSFRRFLRADGHYWTEVEYPADRNYRVMMVGTGDGQARIFNTITEDGAADVVYQYEFSVSASELYQSEIGAIGTAFISSQTRIEPDIISTADSEWIESQPGLAEPERFTQDAPHLSNMIILIACGAGICLIAFLILAVGIIWFTRRSRKA